MSFKGYMLLNILNHIEKECMFVEKIGWERITAEGFIKGNPEIFPPMPENEPRAPTLPHTQVPKLGTFYKQ